jgi:hypothetical protein
MNTNYIATVFGSLALLFLAINFICIIKITDYLKERGIKIRYALLHVFLFDYARQYKSIRAGESGSNGTLYHLFIWSFVLFSIFLLTGIISVAS